MTVATLDATMSVREMTEWAIYFAIEPRGEERADWRTGWLAYVMASMNVRKGTKLKWSTFIPFRKAEAEAAPEFNDENILAAFGKLKRADQPPPSL